MKNDMLYPAYNFHGEHEVKIFKSYFGKDTIWVVTWEQNKMKFKTLIQALAKARRLL